MEGLFVSFGVAFFLTWPFWKTKTQTSLDEAMIAIAKSDLSKGRLTRDAMLKIAREEMEKGNYEYSSVIRELQD